MTMMQWHPSAYAKTGDRHLACALVASAGIGNDNIYLVSVASPQTALITVRIRLMLLLQLPNFVFRPRRAQREDTLSHFQAFLRHK